MITDNMNNLETALQDFGTDMAESDADLKSNFVMSRDSVQIGIGPGARIVRTKITASVETVLIHEKKGTKDYDY
jgi:hypothetical protein